MNIREFRATAELSVAAFALKCGLTRQSIYNYEGGRTEPTLYTAILINEASGGLISFRDMLLSTVEA